MRFQNATFFFIDTYQKLICTIQLQVFFLIRLPKRGYLLCLNFDILILLNVCSQSLKALPVFEFRLLWWILNWVAVFIVAAKDKPLQCIFGVFFLQSDIVSLILKKNKKKRIEKYTLAQQKNPGKE